MKCVLSALLVLCTVGCKTVVIAECPDIEPLPVRPIQMIGERTCVQQCGGYTYDWMFEVIEYEESVAED